MVGVRVLDIVRPHTEPLTQPQPASFAIADPLER